MLPLPFFIKHCCAVLIGVLLVGSTLPQRAQAQPAAIELALFASLEAAAPGQPFSYSIVAKATDGAPHQVTLAATLDAGITLERAAGLHGERCTIEGQRVACNLLLNQDGTTITVQARVASDAADGTTLRAVASATDDAGVVVRAEPVGVTVRGTASTSTATASPSLAPTTTRTPTLTATPTQEATDALPTTTRTATPIRTASPTATQEAATPPSQAATATPDALENNWSPATAAPIAVGVVYDLNFTCPIAGGCEGGDFDYLRVTVKAGMRYLLASYDLGPGVDTVLALYWGDEQTPVATNDDARLGFSFLSALRWTAPSDGEALIRIGPRTGSLKPIVAAANAGSYRFAIQLVDSPDGRALAALIATQTFVPTATPYPTRAPSSASSGTPINPPQAPVQPTPAPGASVAPTTNPVAQNVAKGIAVVIAPSSILHLRPDASSAVVATLPQETLVSLLGESSGLWVRVSTTNDVLPGWVLATDLQRVTALLPSPAAPGATLPVSATAALTTTVATTSTSAAQPATPTIALPDVTRLDPLPPSPAEAPPPRVSLAVQVAVLRGATTKPANAKRTATPTREQGVAGLRVQLVTTLGDVLAEAVTAAGGDVTLTRDLDPNTAVLLRVPALGIDVPVPAADPATAQQDTAQGITITLPGGAK